MFKAVMVIEPDLADGDDFRSGLQAAEERKLGQVGFGDVVGMNADSASDVGAAARNGNALLGIINAGADGDHPRHPGGGGARQDIGELLAEARVGEMAVGVDHYEGQLSLVICHSQQTYVRASVANDKGQMTNDK